MNIWLTSDTHYGHENIIKFCHRPFKDKDEHDETLIENWNNLITRTDLVYHLGDFANGNHRKVRQIRHRLNGKIILILGNHDYRNRLQNLQELFTEVHQYKTIKTSNTHGMFLCHYAMRVWDRSHFNYWHAYGHSHGQLEGQGKSMDVGVDTNNFKPYHLDEIIKIMENKPNNFNFIEKNQEK